MRKVSNEKTGRISGIVARAAAGAMAALLAGAALTAVPYNVLADEVIMEWREENGVKYWYENGVRQGVKYREDGSIDASYRGDEKIYFTDNESANSYGSSRYDYCADTIKSYLMVNADGTITRIEYSQDTENKYNLLLETYNSGYKLISSKRLPMELEIFGGIYCGSEYNYIVFGQSNVGKLDDKEEIRVVKYSKDWERIDSRSFRKTNSTVPFEGGTCRMTEYGNNLFICACHKMYNGHQANMLIILDKNDLHVKDALTEVPFGAVSIGYVSHSFDQFIDTTDGVVTGVQLGDGGPRGVVQLIYPGTADSDSIINVPVQEKIIFDIAQAEESDDGFRYNATGVSIGGYNVSSSHYLTALSSVDQSNSLNQISSTAVRNIYIAALDRQDYNAAARNIQVTDYKSGLAHTPQFVKLADDKYLLLWEYENEGKISLNYAFIGADGNLLTQTYTWNEADRARLSDCEPIIWNGKAVWYTSSSEAGLRFFEVDNDGTTTCKDICRVSGYNGWAESTYFEYWYENGVRQGVKYTDDGFMDYSYRGKEIYDPESGAWYWLDNVLNGAVAKNKDVYQESLAGDWGNTTKEDGNKYGKWVRYDENGCMIKGWQNTDSGRYYFDPVYGTMAKGYVTIDGVGYSFNKITGLLESSDTMDSFDDDGKSYSIDGWHKVLGIQYWYENGVRQGYDPDDRNYRGKEIYDPSSDAWYWLDNVLKGAVAKNKDVYQESLAGDWGDVTKEEGKKYGKWVRYDSNGNMVKGWQVTDNGVYYFDKTYGTMAKGLAKIDGDTYYFDVDNGVMYTGTTVEVDGNIYKCGYDGKIRNDNNAVIKSSREIQTCDRENCGIQEVKHVIDSEYNADGKCISMVYSYQGGTLAYRYEYTYNDEGLCIQKTYTPGKYEKVQTPYIYVYEYDTHANCIKETMYSFEQVSECTEYEYDTLDRCIAKSTVYSDGRALSYVMEYSDNDTTVKWYLVENSGKKILSDEYTYDLDGNLTSRIAYRNDKVWFKLLYEYDKMGNVTKGTEIGGQYPKGHVTFEYEYQYDIYNNIISRINKADEGGTYEYPDSAFEYVYR